MKTFIIYAIPEATKKQEIIIRKIYAKSILSFCICFSSFIFSLNAQVKIGDNPNTINSNSLLELESTNKGLLPPRVVLNSTTAAAPLTAPIPVGMLIYSSGGTVTDGYYVWNGTKWLAISTSTTTRNNYVLVKSATDFPAPAGGIITLVAGTLYEVNGTITLADKIDLNGCKLQGRDGANDKLIYTGSAELFTGSNVGSLNYLTITASTGNIFNISAGGALKNFIVQNSFLVSSSSIGTIQGVGGNVFFENVAFINNTNGITFQNDYNVLLNNSLWSVTNSNIYEKFIGSFNVIQLLGGVRNVSSGNSATAVSISGITSLIGGSIKVAMFLGSGTYVSGSFSDLWEVESFGLNTEKDDVASGNLYLTTTATTVIAVVNTPVKMLGTTTSASLFRITSPASNRLTYVGAKTKKCLIICSLTSTFTGGGSNKYFSFYIAKNGSVLPESKQKVKLINNTDQGPISISCLTSLAPNDYIEVWVENNTDASDMIIQNLNLSVK